MRTKSHTPKKVQLVTLGCSKNWVDSENIITQLVHNDYDVQHNGDHYGPQTVIINTCGFIERAKEESIQTILEFAKLKTEGKIESLYVTGCLSQRYKENLEEEIPEVDAYFGTLEMPALLNRLQVDFKEELIGERLLSTPSHYAYLKISEGCNRTCSFCAIPLMRGPHISVPIEKLVSQAGNLASKGVKELILIAQELSYYGLDLYKKRRLPDLLKELCKVEGIEWIRLHYAYPSHFPLEVIELMKDEKKICNYLDMPLQHISTHVLKSMRRQISKSETIELINSIRKINPGIHLRTTFLVGYPDETEEDFRELCEFVEQFKFERFGVFTYSHEDQTKAGDLVDKHSQELKEERAQTLMQIQEHISLDLNTKKVGKIFKTIIDRKEKNHYIGRTEFDSPEVDNEVHIEASNRNYLRVGDFAQIEITKADSYDLFGVPVNTKSQ
ncbi:MAG: 30S ribosomal protein S12 methylthiotransferase RimO [Saprospiraceae bacterium]|nr:30S ribosomal protein S12 methylthiotransferase RimO [Saprospiraceae bacterium]